MFALVNPPPSLTADVFSGRPQMFELHKLIDKDTYSNEEVSDDWQNFS